MKNKTKLQPGTLLLLQNGGWNYPLYASESLNELAIVPAKSLFFILSIIQNPHYLDSSLIKLLVACAGKTKTTAIAWSSEAHMSRATREGYVKLVGHAQL